MFLHVAAPKKKWVREPHQLPPGRHGLPRAFVVAHQRRRLLAAVAEVCQESGYAAMSVRAIVVAAGVSRTTFYLHFRDKEDVFLAAYDDAARRIVACVERALASADTLVDRTRASLTAVLTAVSAEPAVASLCLVEVQAAGQRAQERRDALMGDLVTLLDETAADGLPTGRRPPRLVAETLVGGIEDVLASRVLSGRLAELPGLLPDLMFALLLPYVGTEAAHAMRAGLLEERNCVPNHD